jgi:hypothetical protein
MKKASQKLYQTNHVILHQDDILTDIISSIKAAKKDDLVIVVPENMRLFHHRLNVKILAKEILPLPYQVTFFSTDFEVIDMFREAGLQATASQEIREDTFQAVEEKVSQSEETSVTSAQSPQEPTSFFLNLNEVQKEEQASTFEPVQSSQAFTPTQTPQSTSDFSLPLSQFDTEPKTEFQGSHEKDQPTHQKSSRLKRFSIIGGILLLLAIVSVAIFVPSVDIEVVYDSNYLQKDIEVTLDTAVDSLDVQNSILPAEVKTFSAETTGTLTATGENTTATRARATVTVFNNTSTSQPLVSSTRLRNVDDVQFRITDSINVPAGGSLQVEMLADGEGAQYNIQPGRLTIPGLAGTPSRFQNIYAELSEPITSGTASGEKAVTEEDIQKFRDEMSKKLTDDIALQVQQDTTENLKIINTRDVLENINYEGLPTVGDAGETFEITASSTIDGVYYDNAQALQLATGTVQEQVLEGQTLGESLSISFASPEEVEGTSQFKTRMYIEYIIVDDITQEAIRQDLAGKTFSEVQEYADTFNYVSELNVYVRPGFWPIMPLLGRNINVRFVYP